MNKSLVQSGGNRCYKVTVQLFFMCHAVYKAFYTKKIPVIVITTS